MHLQDGEIRYIDGNPDHPLNKGVICAIGASGIIKQVSPARLTRPLKRRAGAERGARGFLLGEHGRGHDLHDRRLVLGIRRPGGALE